MFEHKVQDGPPHLCWRPNSGLQGHGWPVPAPAVRQSTCIVIFAALSNACPSVACPLTPPPVLLHSPPPQGYMLNTDVMQELWDRAFSSHILSVIPKECSLCVTEPLMNPSKLQKNLVQLAFEYYGFQSLYIGTAPQLAHYDQVCAPNTSLFSPCGSVVVDAGAVNSLFCWLFSCPSPPPHPSFPVPRRLLVFARRSCPARPRRQLRRQAHQRGRSFVD